MKHLRNDGGFAILQFSVIMAAIMATIFMFASSNSKSLVDKVGRSQGVAYGNELSVKFAQRLRWAYDAARADALNPSLGLCSKYGGTTVTLSGGIRLCMTNMAEGICVKHPQAPSQKVCITPNGSDPSLIATRLTDPRPLELFEPAPKRTTSIALVAQALLTQSYAQSIYSPPVPSSVATSNSLTVSATNCLGGNCRAICGGAGKNADCVTYRFCPLVGTCSANQLVWQTVAFIRTP